MKVSEEVSLKLAEFENHPLESEGQLLHVEEELKKIPRSGKSTRIDHFGLDLPKRSLYDHIITLARNADIFIEYLELDLDKKKLAQLIAFHDVAEVIIGDVPFFTSGEIAKKIFMSKEQKEEKEKVANLSIINCLDGNMKEEYQMYVYELDNALDSPEKRFLDYLDRIDPILSIWRYIDKFGERFDINKFLKAMNDFFINPKVKEYALEENTRELVLFLQDPEEAKDFNAEGFAIFEKRNIGIFDKIFFLKVLEHEDMYFV